MPLIYFCKKMEKMAFNSRLRKICTNGKFSKRITPKTFRHSCAVHLLTQMGNLRAVQQHLVHRAINTTRFYEQFVTTDRIKQYMDAHPRA